MLLAATRQGGRPFRFFAQGARSVHDSRSECHGGSPAKSNRHNEIVLLADHFRTLIAAVCRPGCNEDGDFEMPPALARECVRAGEYMRKAAALDSLCGRSAGVPPDVAVAALDGRSAVPSYWATATMPEWRE